MFAMLIEPGISDVGGSLGICKGDGSTPTGECGRDGGSPSSSCIGNGYNPERGIDLVCINTGGTPTGACTEGGTPHSPVQE